MPWCKKFNPNSVRLEDVQKMTPREFRQYTFLKLNGMDHKLSNIDNRTWAILTGIIATIGTVVLVAVL